MTLFGALVAFVHSARRLVALARKSPNPRYALSPEGFNIIQNAPLMRIAVTGSARARSYYVSKQVQKPR